MQFEMIHHVLQCSFYLHLIQKAFINKLYDGNILFTRIKEHEPTNYIMAIASYKISGTADLKPFRQVEKGIKHLEQMANKVAKASGILLIANTIGKITGFWNANIKESAEAFKAQNAALTKANLAFSQNMKLTGDAIKNIKDEMSKVSLNNFIDGDTLNNAAALASNMGLNEQQIKKVLKAASDLSAATGEDLNTCVKNLSMSYSGNVASLKKLNPELANLTEEELKNGKAVDLLANKYDGFAESMSNTFEGRDKQFQNTFSDLQANVGSIVQTFKFMLEDALLEPFQKLNAYLEEHKELEAKIKGLQDRLKSAEESKDSLAAINTKLLQEKEMLSLIVSRQDSIIREHEKNRDTNLSKIKELDDLAKTKQ